MLMLEMKGVRKTFNPGTVNEKVALDGVDLALEKGDFATIVGSNGAGKSTLFNAITGGFIADEGCIVLGGEDITFTPEFRRSKVIGHLFQDPLKGTAPQHDHRGKTWPWPICGRARPSGPIFPASPARTRSCSGSAWPCWAWAWRTG